MSRPSSRGAMPAAGDQAKQRRRAGSLAERCPGGAREAPDSLPRRAGSLRQRYPGDMSHRPLAQIKREYRAADRLQHHHLQHRSDTIDSLDITGPIPGITYHHGGPFDPAMKERNVNKKYSPIEAVKDADMEALKATPAGFVRDSLERHVPLQGTAVIPPGMKDLSGRTMRYEEGADLMREEDAPGGPYRRWDHVVYRDDDWKGKGEPSFSADRTRRAQKARGKQPTAASHSDSGAVYYEMQPSSSFREHSGGSRLKEGEIHVRQRSLSSVEQMRPSLEEEGMAGSSGLQRSNTTGKNLAQSLKRRLVSSRKKAVSSDAVY